MNQFGDPALRQKLLATRVVVAALAMGVVIFGGAIFLITRGRPLGGQGLETPLLVVLGALGAGLIGAFPVVRRKLFDSFRQRHGAEASQGDVLDLFRQVTILGAAMSEAFCLFSLIIFMLTGSVVGLAAAAAGLFVLLRFLPTDGRWAGFQEALSGRGPV